MRITVAAGIARRALAGVPRGRVVLGIKIVAFPPESSSIGVAGAVAASGAGVAH